MDNFDDPFSTVGDMKFHLRDLLDSKEKQLQQASSLGQRVMAQQMELEECVRQLQVLEADKDKIDLKAREQYLELVETISAWDSENAQLFSAFAGTSKAFEAIVLPPESNLSHNFDSTTGDMKFHLQYLLGRKEKQLQLASSLGQRVMAQQMELDEYIRQLQEREADAGDDDEIDLGAREQYHELAETISAWDSENAQLSSAFAGSLRAFEAIVPPPKPVLSHMRDFNNPFNAGDLKYDLQNLLDRKEKQLQQAGSLCQRVLAQQMELEERIRQLQMLEADDDDDDEIDLQARERYRELAETILTWDSENAHLTSAFTDSFKRSLNGSFQSPIAPYDDLPHEEPGGTKASASMTAAQSRRAKNAAHRADDVEFAFGIGSGLLTEVRRLQSLLGERDKAIQDMKEEKDDLEKTFESIRTALRQQEQNSDKYKEENWNIEVTVQELRSQLSDVQATTQRLDTEHKRLTKALALARDNTNHHMIENEKLRSTLEELKNKHETDIAQAHKHATGLSREKSDLQQTIDTLKAEKARAERLPTFGSPLTPGAKDIAGFLSSAGQDKYETDIAKTRKHAERPASDKSDLQQTLRPQEQSTGIKKS